MRRLWGCSLAALILAGCSHYKEGVGGAEPEPHDVLVGGPVSGVTLKDLPEPVKRSLKQQVASGEVADIDKEQINGKTGYRICFSHPGINPGLFILEDGRIYSGN
jgi:hypothetical protein